ncbi:MAG TPA: maleylpyruvate isomerase N-terminal domain-containing protein [Acidimicrobiia bacterium]|nr:maleylpyruvate isomerase N-terminal domain-containing protein [Acidimicrobiia bacterium]
MAETTMLSKVRTALSVVSARTAGLVESLPDTAVPIPGSAWTVREAAVHLAMVGFRYAGMAYGEPNQYPSLAPEECARRNDQLNADIPEFDPGKLAALMHEGTECLLAATARCDDTRTVLFHCGNVMTIPHLVGTALAEHLVHGYDMAVAVGRPWPIDPHHAALGLFGYGPSYAVCLNPATARAHTAGYAIELTTGERFTIRFVDGEGRLEPPDSGPVDCTITADPVVFLLVGSGRVSQWAAIAFGLVKAGGHRPELALGLNDLFLFP